MTILSIQFAQIGNVPAANPNNTLPAASQTPSIVYIATNDTNATVTTAGYLNQLQQSTTENFVFNNTQMALVYTTDDGVNFYQISVVGSLITLIPDVNPGNVLLPVVANHLAVFTNVAGQIGDPIGTAATHLGNIAAGASGTAGTLSSFPAAPNTGAFIIAATASGGAFNTTLRNASMGQGTVISIPDPGVATANIILSQNAGTQTIGTGNLTVSNGSIAVGNSATPTLGTFTSFPAASGGANDKLVLSAVTTGGNFTSTISNGTQGQTSVFTLPDPGNAAARFLVGATATPFTANHSLVASGTGGLIADAGYQMKTVAQAAVAGGAAAQTVVDAFCTAASMVVACWNDTTNPVQIQTVAAGIGQFVVTSTADPGASHINYIITKV